MLVPLEHAASAAKAVSEISRFIVLLSGSLGTTQCPHWS
jgi:hypothetical protein